MNINHKHIACSYRDLHNNALSVVTENTFASLGNLQHLIVTSNHMSYIAQGAFSDLGALQIL